MVPFARSISLALAILAAPASALALCEGTDLLPQRSDDFRDRINAATAVHPYPEGRFWEVEKDGRTSTLFGTLHVPDPDISILPDALSRRIDDARIVYVEMSRPEEQRMQRAMLLNPSLIRHNGPERLKDHLSEDEWAALLDAVEPYGMNAQSVRQVAPWFLGLTIAVPPCVTLATYQGHQIIDRMVEADAQDAGVQVEGLERYEDLFALLSADTFEEQVKGLQMSLPQLGDAVDNLETTMQMYQRGEILKIWEYGRALVAEDYGDAAADAMMAEISEALLVTRNTSWMETLRPELSQGNVVVAVGALHLGGEFGLLRMLEDQGFAIRRLSE